jgi:2-polyprenyl-6-methoxyphenol hydroxylase-like FAD-dependent oxidoreductase
MAMEDAQVLAESLTAESHLDAALTTFVTRRRPPVAEYARSRAQRRAGSMAARPSTTAFGR